MATTMARADYPITTIAPSALSSMDLTNYFRPRQWDQRPSSIMEQKVENEVALISFIDRLPLAEMTLTNPVLSWRVGTRADTYSKCTYAIAAADTYLALDDSRIVRTGHTLHFTDYDTELLVIDTDDDLSEGWTNAAGDAANIRVDRSIGGPAVVIPIGTVAEGGLPLMGEQGTPKEGVTTTPGDPTFNFFSLAGIYCTLTRVQMESLMEDRWGTLEKEHENIQFQLRLGKQMDLLFGKRWSGPDPQSAQGQMYKGAGLIQQIRTNVMEAGSLGVSLAWPRLNDYFENLFVSDLSAMSKDHFCGSSQFRDFLKTARAAGAEVEMLGVQSGVDNSLSLGTNSFVVYTDSGKQIRVHELKWAFYAPNKVDWGVTLDNRNIAGGRYAGFGEQWYFDIENPAQRITVRSDAIIDSWNVNVYDETTLGVIRGGTRGLAVR